MEKLSETLGLKIKENHRNEGREKVDNLVAVNISEDSRKALKRASQEK
jgi:hypothetical protein